MADLDPKTLRWAARRLLRSERHWENAGSVGVAVDFYLFRKLFLSEARAIERKRKTEQGGKRRG